MPSKWQLHVQEWSNCTKCALSERRTKVVLARGQIPCDMLYVGEAAGESENVLGKPFMGPAGALLNHIVEEAIGQDTLRIAFTNIVACIPYDEDGNKTAEPEDECIEACKPRLQQFVELANPKLIVCVGKLATDWLTPGYQHSIKLHRPIKDASEGIRLVSITHPSAILRANMAQRGLMVQRAIVTIKNAVEEL